ncbi:hypothetical protein IQ231_19780 [Cuspidothrix issatschenkoi LEGE 03284]|uniref:element excision factor XisH family protein n=1 Tax=Cuspidothrix issatschenkoi TaxID=230752 RepID=UPI0018808142|nr:hypothetical protein [Cuspidothrix issatschenkoi LEGE 03284]
MTGLRKLVVSFGKYGFIINPERKLYLAIPEAAYQDFFLKPAIQDILSDQMILF